MFAKYISFSSQYSLNSWQKKFLGSIHFHNNKHNSSEKIEFSIFSTFSYRASKTKIVKRLLFKALFMNEN